MSEERRYWTIKTRERTWQVWSDEGLLATFATLREAVLYMRAQPGYLSVRI
jgi:hypothetical protein